MREIKLTDITREELWAKQRLSFTDIDYAVWNGINPCFINSRR